MSEPANTQKSQFTLPQPRKKRRWPVVLLVLALAAAAVGWFVVRPILRSADQVNDLLYTQDTAAYRDVTVSVSGTAAILPADSYRAVAMVQGEILEAPFEEGDTVQAGDLLFRFDSKAAESSIQRAQITVEQARLSYDGVLEFKTSAQKKLAFFSPAAGTVTKLCAAEGDELTSGDPLLELLDGSGETVTVTAGTSGELKRLYCAEGDTVDPDQLLGYLGGSKLDAQIENALLSLRTAQLSLQSARDQLESYTVTSPISGTVIEKNYKAGDSLEAGGGYLAVIYDLSGLTFDMHVDELYIHQVRPGQTVRITANALEGQEFTGTVRRVNINGTTMNGVTTYPVTVEIHDPGDLLPGMNISADIIVDSVSHALTIPVEMVGRGNVVQVLPADAYDRNGKPDYSKLEERPVTLGCNDDSYIQILSGLSEGETVVCRTEVTNIMEQMMNAMGSRR